MLDRHVVSPGPLSPAWYGVVREGWLSCLPSELVDHDAFKDPECNPLEVLFLLASGYRHHAAIVELTGLVSEAQQKPKTRETVFSSFGGLLASAKKCLANPGWTSRQEFESLVAELLSLGAAFEGWGRGVYGNEDSFGAPLPAEVCPNPLSARDLPRLATEVVIPGVSATYLPNWMKKPIAVRHKLYTQVVHSILDKNSQLLETRGGPRKLSYAVDGFLSVIDCCSLAIEPEVPQRHVKILARYTSNGALMSFRGTCADLGVRLPDHSKAVPSEQLVRMASAAVAEAESSKDPFSVLPMIGQVAEGLVLSAGRKI